ncbi:MAG: GNAT family N-acetyltransferase [Candidatus Bathyarchaeia archaeon]
MKQEIFVREAKSSDREAVLRFCEQTFEWGDYIADVWDYWLTDPAGKIFVATDKDTPVGIVHVTILKTGEAWLEGARTAPEYRRKGIASLLNKACIEFAVEKGAKIARLITDSTNVVAQAALAKLGFSQISDWALMELDGCRLEASENVRWAEKSDVDDVLRYFDGSECFKKSAGLFTILFRWVTLDSKALERFIERRTALIYEKLSKIQGLLLFDDTVKWAWRENSIQTCYIDGNFVAALNLGRFLKRHCYNEGIAKIYGAMCNHPPLLNAFSELGFVNHDHTELVYEKRLV